MRRQTIPPWESEGRDAVGRLRQALGVLLEQERNVDAGTVENEQLLETLESVNRTKGSVFQWWQEWQVGTDSAKTSRAVVLSVYRGCLPPLLDSVDIYSQSLALSAIAPDLDAGDGDLAGQGVRAAKNVSSFALQFLDDTPALRPVDRAAVDATLAGLETRSRVMLALVEPIGRRLRELRREGGYGL
ncbi:MAG: hypothetical protein ABSC41_18035 [Acidimicrobiales bacterium]|jgi:hypothetical protein